MSDVETLYLREENFGRKCITLDQNLGTSIENNEEVLFETRVIAYEDEEIETLLFATGNTSYVNISDKEISIITAC
jgi:hypothetical protein